MNLGKTMFAHRAISFAQLTYRESLRDIEICLLANQKKLYGMDFRLPVKGSMLANTNGGARLAHLGRFGDCVLIRRARKLYCNDSWVSVSPRTRMKIGSVRV